MVCASLPLRRGPKISGPELAGTIENRRVIGELLLHFSELELGTCTPTPPLGDGDPCEFVIAIWISHLKQRKAWPHLQPLVP